MCCMTDITREQQEHTAHCAFKLLTCWTARQLKLTLSLRNAEASLHEVPILADKEAAGFLSQYAQNGAMHGAFGVEIDANGTFDVSTLRLGLSRHRPFRTTR